MLLHENEPGQILLSKILALQGKSVSLKVIFTLISLLYMAWSGQEQQLQQFLDFNLKELWAIGSTHTNVKKRFERNAMEIEQCL